MQSLVAFRPSSTLKLVYFALYGVLTSGWHPYENGEVLYTSPDFFGFLLKMVRPSSPVSTIQNGGNP